MRANSISLRAPARHVFAEAREKSGVREEAFVVGEGGCIVAFVSLGSFYSGVRCAEASLELLANGGEREKAHELTGLFGEPSLDVRLDESVNVTLI